MKKALSILSVLFFMSSTLIAQIDKLESEKFKTNAGELEIKFVGHGSLIFVFNEKYIYVDPSILYPYHYGKTNTQELVDLLKDHSEIKVVIKKM